MHRRAFEVLVGVTFVAFAYLIGFIFLKVPGAQLQAGGVAQKILYFHAPAGYAMYLCGGVCLVASALYLMGATDARDAVAKASAECAVMFGAMMLVSGPLWAKKAWGVYWTWDPRLTTTLLSVLIYTSIVVLRTFGGNGDAERRFSAALGILGTVNLPIIHYSVQKWGGNHPTVITKGGGGLKHPDMKMALFMGFAAMTLFAVLVLWSRSRLAIASAKLARCEEEAAARGLLDV